MPKVVNINRSFVLWDKLNNLAEKRGITVMELSERAITTLNNGVPADGYWISENGVTVIVIGRSLKGMYRNSVLAHELGHAVLHGGQTNKAAYSKRYRNSREVEADRFASRLIRWLNRRCKVEREAA